MKRNFELTILMPCLNESETLSKCINRAKKFISASGIAGEILVSDNGSTDGSQKKAAKLGARVVSAPVKGYGSALITGINAARGKYVIMGDADDSYDFTDLKPFVDKLRKGYELVMGNRFKGGIEKGAMPPLHRYLGNPVLSGIGRLFFNTKIGDFHSGLRGFSRKAILSLDLNTMGMEFASEMVVKAVLHKLKITEVPVKLYPDGRSRAPHLKSWSDGWRHLKFLLMFSPNWLFLYPGILMIVLGLAGTSVLSFTSIKINHVSFDVHTMLFSVLMVILGVQIVSFSAITHSYAAITKLYPTGKNPVLRKPLFTVEKGVVLGGILLLTGLIMSSAGVVIWANKGFGDLMPVTMLRLLLPAVLLIAIGLQILFTSFLLGVFGIKTKLTS